MGEFIKHREFSKVMAKPNNKQLYQFVGHGTPPILFVDEIEGVIYRLEIETAHNFYYSKEGFDDG